RQNRAAFVIGGQNMRAVLSVAVAVLCLAGQAVGRDPSDGVPGELRAEIRVDEAAIFVDPDVLLEVGDVGTIYFDARFVDDSPWSPETEPWSSKIVIELERSGRLEIGRAHV